MSRSQGATTSHPGQSRPYGRRLARVCLAAAFFLLALGAASAQAALTPPVGHRYIGALTTGIPIESPEAVAVDASGNVFITHAAGEAAVVEEFSAAGHHVATFGEETLTGTVLGLAVDSSGRVYVTEVGEHVGVVVFAPNGTGGYESVATWTGANAPEPFEEPTGVAVTKESVFVLDRSQGVVDQFALPPAGSKVEPVFKGRLPLKLEGLTALAAGPSKAPAESVYVAGTFSTASNSFPAIEAFSAAGTFERRITGHGVESKGKAPYGGLGEITGLGVEGGTGNLYVAEDTIVAGASTAAVDEFTATGEWIGWITGTEPEGHYVPLASPLGVATDANGAHVYVVDGGSASGTPAAVDVFGPAIEVPSVQTGSATTKGTPAERRTTATLSGKVNTRGALAKYFFEYGEVGHSAQRTPTLLVEGETTIKAAVTGLVAGREYVYRLILEAPSGVTVGALKSYATPPAVTGVTTAAATGVTATGATLHGSLEPEEIETHYRFEYGETPALGEATPYAATSAAGVVGAEAALTGLRGGVTYHYRLSAYNQFGTTYGAEMTFKTAGPAISGPTVGKQASEPVSHTSERVNAQINPNGVAANYWVEYGETAAYGSKSAEAELPAGAAPVPVSVELSGLKLASTYHYRFVARSTGGEPVYGPDQTFTTVLIDSESATEVAATSATLNASINPLASKVECDFEWGLAPTYGAVAVPGPACSSSGGEELVTAAKLAGLLPSTRYHYRVVVTVQGVAEKGYGPDRTFTTAAATPPPRALPDERAYELVTPPNKHGAAVEALTREGGVVQASENGDALAYIVDGTVVENPETNRSPEAQQALAVRGTSTWGTQELVPPHYTAQGVRGGKAQEYRVFSPDLALAITQPSPFGLTPLAEPPLSPPVTPAERGHQQKTIYARANTPLAPASTEAAIYNEAVHNGEVLAGEAGGTPPGFLPLLTEANVLAGAPFGGVEQEESRERRVIQNVFFLTSTPDLTHSVISSKVPLATSGPSAPGLYEWEGNKLQLVSILPDGKPAENPSAQIELGNGAATQKPTNWRHAISSEGRRVIWTTEEGSTQGAEVGHLYMRDTQLGKTVQVDAPQAGQETHSRGEALFQIASADGTKIFFTDPQRLTAAATAVPGKPDLYVCEVVESGGVPTCNLTDLTPDEHAGESASVQGMVLGAAEDGSTVYYVATGALAGGARAGAFNLYAAHLEGQGWHTQFVSALSSEDGPDWGITFVPEQSRDEAQNITARVSPNGNYLAFMSNERLTGYDNTDINSGHPDEEVFLFDRGASALHCASCNPTGARPRGVFDIEGAGTGEGAGLLVDRPLVWGASLGKEAKRTDHWLAGSLPSWTRVSLSESSYQSRYLDDSGRLFFNSADALLEGIAAPTRPETVGGHEFQVGVENVYEYEPSGQGTCALASGCVGLISSGTSPRESAFIDASATGNDVFFVTTAALLPQDIDSSADIYDARVCGAEPCLTPPAAAKPPCDSAEECRGAAPGPPAFAAAQSAVFVGPGNPHVVIPQSGTLPSQVTKPAPLTKAQKLARALAACHRLPRHSKAQKHRRAVCEAKARKAYGTSKKKKGKK